MALGRLPVPADLQEPAQRVAARPRGKVTALKAGLLRIPGGNYLEGVTLETRFDWKKTLGPIEQRPGHQNTAWGYWSTDGMGLLEYLRMAEDIGAQPLLSVFAGYTLTGSMCRRRSSARTSRTRST